MSFIMTQILSINSLNKTFKNGKQQVHALREISLDVNTGECLAIVGESGSGKTTLANILLGVFPQSSGEIRFEGDILPNRRTLVHRSAIQLVQQNPLSSLNPKRKVGASIRLGLDVFKIGERSSRWNIVEDALEEVGLPREYRHRFPVALSGGQCQRIAIARALVCQSRLLILDEPTSSLDVLVQARVLKLLDSLRRNRELTYIFITHDLSVVRNIADRVAVFCEGKIVECGFTKQVFNSPVHEYTKQLLSAVPVIDSKELSLRNSLKIDEHKE